MGRYRVKGCAIKVGGKLYPEGSLIGLSNEEAEPLYKYLEPADEDVAQSPSAVDEGEPVKKPKGKRSRKGGRKARV